MSGNTAIYLYSSVPHATGQDSWQRKVKTWLEAKKVRYQSIDASLAENKDVRNELYDVSGKRGGLPQVFIVDSEAGSTKYAGDYEGINSLIESDSIPADILEKNPQIPTFTKMFASCMEGQ
jgi:hypothetical protein